MTLPVKQQHDDNDAKTDNERHHRQTKGGQFQIADHHRLLGIPETVALAQQDAKDNGRPADYREQPALVVELGALVRQLVGIEPIPKDQISQ